MQIIYKCSDIVEKHFLVRESVKVLLKFLLKYSKDENHYVNIGVNLCKFLIY